MTWRSSISQVSRTLLIHFPVRYKKDALGRKILVHDTNANPVKERRRKGSTAWSL